ncbi:MAG: HD domain-containing protein [Acidobacteriota bacterium]
MKLRGQLILSHVVLVLTGTLLIGTVNLFLALRSTAESEQLALARAAAAGANLFQYRIDAVRRAAHEAATLVPRLPTDSPTGATVALNELLQRYRCERVEVFTGLTRSTSAYRWERGSDPLLHTHWLPAEPRVATRIASGQDATWVQGGGNGPASLKVCVPVPATQGGQKKWVVVTEPLDGLLLSTLAPGVASVALLAGDRLLSRWPAPATDAPEEPATGKTPLAAAGLERFFDPVRASCAITVLDSGQPLSLRLEDPAVASAVTLTRSLRAWFLIALGGLLVAGVLGSGVAARLLAPLQALLDGTAAMARGHLMVRLPPQGKSELGALTVEFNRMADELRRTYMGVISTLAEVVEAKSHFTREHIERVERLAMATADALERRGWARFSSQRRFTLSVAAVLHDVGKISISGDILNKSGPLDDGERREILTHPERGALIVERMGKLGAAAEIIRCAHEHFNGSGYPRGLKGEEIPIEARIILAVDAYDAMTADRPYSQRRSPEEAIAELRAEAGRQFDPVVVEALIDAVQTSPDRWAASSSDTGLYRLLNPDGLSTPSDFNALPRVRRG